jgi:hypothetical protein
MYLFCSSVGGPHGHNNEELSSSSSCSFVLVLHFSQVHDDKELGSLSSSFFLFQCYKSQGHDDKKFGSSSSCFLFVQMLKVPMGTTMRSWAPHHHAILFQCYKSLKCTTMKTLAPCCHAFFCSSVASPQGQDNEKFVILFFLIPVTQVLDNKVHHWVFFLFWSFKFDGCFICFLVLVKSLFYFVLWFFATLVDAKLNKNKDC